MKVQFRQICLLLLVFLSSATRLSAQSLSEYSLKFEPVDAEAFSGVQSFAWAKHGDDILIIGGRLDGLHRRQPFASFDAAGHNNQLIVINTQSMQVWKFPVANLEEPLASQLKATNHCFHQQNDSLVLLGGYGIDETTKDHVTFDGLMVIQVPELIDAIKNEGNSVDVSTAIRFHIHNKNFAVTGGQLNYVNGWYYLVGGHEFQGRYNPNDMPTFKQEYRESVMRFGWKMNEKSSSTSVLSGNFTFDDEPKKDSLLHKRDFNMVKVRHVPDTSYLVALSGVFQYEENLPFQNIVQITPELNVREYPNFRQLYNQYECADFSVYDPNGKTTSVFLIGGISNFYDSLGILTQNDDVPFVPTLSRLLFAPDGTVFEYLLPDRLPQLMGSGAAFIPNNDPAWNNGMFEWQGNGEEELFVGWMIGGIVADQPSTFWYTEGEASHASNGIYKVYLQRTSELLKLNTYGKHPLKVRCETDYKGKYVIHFHAPKALKVTVNVKNQQGKLLKTKVLDIAAAGDQSLSKLIPKTSGIYTIEVVVENHPLWAWTQYLYVE